MKRIALVVLILISLASVFSQTAVEPALIEGKYQIATLENLYWIAAPDSVVPVPDTASRWSANYVQTCDINAAPTHTWFPDTLGGYYGWLPIAFSSDHTFTGDYDGRGFKIDSLYSKVGGLFSHLMGSYSCGIRLTNLVVDSASGGGLAYQIIYGSVVENCSVSGSVQCSGPAGGISSYTNDSYISGCSVSGQIVSTESYAGGITGCLSVTGDYTGSLSHSYSTASVSGVTRTGGLIGWTGGYIQVTNCYSSGLVTCQDNYVGGLVWSSYSSLVTGCFWDIESSGQTTSGAGTGKTTAEMKTLSTFTDAGWDFDYYWEIDPALNDGYPFLKWETRAGYFDGGFGTSVYPYLISNLSHLEFLSSNPEFWSYYYLQTADINASATSTWNSSSGWNPIGNNTIPFTGTYAGAGHSINGLYISRSAGYYQGFLGKTIGASISNLTLENVSITARDHAGAIAGSTESGNISRCFASGSISGRNNTGGLIGYNNGSTVSQSISSVNVTGTGTCAGGFIGYNYAGCDIDDCYAMGEVAGNDNVGGFSGRNNSVSNTGYITNCYSACPVTGNSNVGGFSGSSDLYLVQTSFWDTEVSGQSLSDGGSGKTTLEMKNGTTYAVSGWDFEGTWAIDSINNGGYPWLKWLGFPVQGPSAPENVSIIYDQSGVYVSWSQVAGAMSYNIYYSYDPYAAFPEGWTYAATTGNSEEDLLWIDYDNESSSKKFYVVVAVN